MQVNNESTVKRYKSESEILSRMNYLRGLFAVLIILGHCGRRFESEQILLAIPHYGAFVWVCFFFVVSGWSLAYNYNTKSDYLEGFWKRKVFKLVLLAVETEVIAKILCLVISKKEIVVDLTILCDINWYIYEMIFLYIVYWITYRFIKNNLFREITIWILSVFIAIVTWMLYKYGSWDGWTYAYYFSTLCFPLGVSIHKSWERIQNKKNIIMVGGCIGAIVSSICVFTPKDSFVGGIVLHNILGICAMYLLIIVICVLDVKKIKFLRFLTENATYLYLYQFCVMDIMQDIYRKINRPVDGIYVIAVLSFTVVLAVGIKNMNKLLSMKEMGR